MPRVERSGQQPAQSGPEVSRDRIDDIYIQRHEGAGGDGTDGRDQPKRQFSAGSITHPLGDEAGQAPGHNGEREDIEGRAGASHDGDIRSENGRKHRQHDWNAAEENQIDQSLFRTNSIPLLRLRRTVIVRAKAWSNHRGLRNPNRGLSRCGLEYAADGRDDERRGHHQHRPQPEHQAARLPPAAIFFLSVSQTLRTSAVISEQSSICRK
jgi:hypothetical protein